MTAHDNGSESEDSGTENELTAASDKADRGDATSAAESATSQDVSASDEASPPDVRRRAALGDQHASRWWPSVLSW